MCASQTEKFRMKLTQGRYPTHNLDNTISKLDNKEEVQGNKEMLLSKVENLLSRITSQAMIDKMPPGIRFFFLKPCPPTYTA